jgi:hypothetical protein
VRKVIVFTAVLVATLLTAVTPASADKSKVNFNGLGTYEIRSDGSAALAGSATGEPFDGRYEATLVPADGTLPEPGACEPATAMLRLEGVRDRFLELSSHGTVCGQYLQAPFVVTQVFTGRYAITAASRRPLVGTDGFVELRLTVDGRASAFAIDT